MIDIISKWSPGPTVAEKANKEEAKSARVQGIGALGWWLSEKTFFHLECSSPLYTTFGRNWCPRASKKLKCERGVEGKVPKFGFGYAVGLSQVHGHQDMSQKISSNLPLNEEHRKIDVTAYIPNIRFISMHVSRNRSDVYWSAACNHSVYEAVYARRGSSAPFFMQCNAETCGFPV